MTTPALTPADLNRFLAENFADWVRDLGLEVTQTAPDHTVSRMANTPALSRVGGIGRDLRHVPSWWSEGNTITVPAVLIRDFQFTGQSR